MPMPPKQKTPPASPIQSEHQAIVSPSINVDDFVDLNTLNEMIEKENEASSAQWLKRRRVEELQGAKEIEAAKV